METRRDVFQAIADPTRREILSLLSTQKLTVNSVAENFSISRPAVSKHVKVLTECGLITIRAVGRERYCEAQLDRLNEVSVWVQQYRQFWESKLDALEHFLNESVKSKKNIKNKNRKRK